MLFYAFYIVRATQPNYLFNHSTIHIYTHDRVTGLTRGLRTSSQELKEHFWNVGNFSENLKKFSGVYGSSTFAESPS